MFTKLKSTASKLKLIISTHKPIFIIIIGILLLIPAFFIFYLSRYQIERRAETLYSVPSESSPSPLPSSSDAGGSGSGGGGGGGSGSSPTPSSNPIHEDCGVTIINVTRDSTNPETATKIVVSNAISHFDVEIRVTTTDGQMTAYQEPVVTQDETYYYWTWVLEKPLEQITKVDFYMQTGPGYQPGGKYCGSWIAPSASTTPSPISSIAPSSSPFLNSINLKVKFDGVPANDNNINLAADQRSKNIWVAIYPENSSDEVYGETLAFSYNESEMTWIKDITLAGQFSSGNYIFKLKGPAHRQIVFCQPDQARETICIRGGTAINLTAGENYTLNFAGHPLEFGDVDQDGSVDVADYSLVKACKNSDARKGQDIYENQGCKWSDGNFDGGVDNTDIDLLYKTLLTKPDDE